MVFEATSTPAVRSELYLEIEIAWTFSEYFQLFVDLVSILVGESNGDILKFAKSLVAAEGEGQIELDGGLTFTLGLGLEYVSGSPDKEINAYISGKTGLEVSLDISGTADFDVQIGPFTGSLLMDVDITGAADTSGPMLLKVGMDKSKNYYLSDPGDFSRGRDGFEIVNGIGGLLDEIEFDFDGAITAGMDAAIQ